MQLPLSQGPEQLIDTNGSLYYYPGWLASQEATRLFQRFTNELHWQQEHITMYGKRMPVPRLSAWYADAGISYRYSGILHEALPWTPTLGALRRQLAQLAETPLNSVLANLYRNGQDTVGWHADDEAELGPMPVIVSVSLGATRFFDLKHLHSGQKLRVPLHHGDVVVMRGALQQYWHHQVPRQKRVLEPRINLTFRHTTPR